MEGPIKDDEDRHTNRTIPVECDICHKTIKNKYELQRHKMNIHSEKRTKNKCPICDFASPLPSGLKRHIQTVHKGEKPFKCPWLGCDERFSQRGNMEVHYRNHTGEKPFACEKCDKCFKAQNGLKQHNLSHHTDPEVRDKLKTHMCEECGIAFETPYKLKLHMVNHHHTDEKPHTCSICPKKFTHPFQLKRHENAHLGVKPEKKRVCTICGYKCQSKTDFEKHERTHTGETPFICDICGKSFKNKGYLSTHKLLHAEPEAMPYECPVCHKKGYDRSNMKKHMKVHGENLEMIGHRVEIKRVSDAGKKKIEAARKNLEAQKKGRGTGTRYRKVHDNILNDSEFSDIIFEGHCDKADNSCNQEPQEGHDEIKDIQPAKMWGAKTNAESKQPSETDSVEWANEEKVSKIDAEIIPKGSSENPVSEPTLKKIGTPRMHPIPKPSVKRKPGVNDIQPDKMSEAKADIEIKLSQQTSETVSMEWVSQLEAEIIVQKQISENPVSQPEVKKIGRPRKHPIPDPSVRRKPGRPRINPIPDPSVKRKPGRPRINPIPDPSVKRKPGRPRINLIPDSDEKGKPDIPMINPVPDVGEKKNAGRPSEHPLLDSDRYYCSECNQAFATMPRLMNHKRKLHSEESAKKVDVSDPIPSNDKLTSMMNIVLGEPAESKSEGEDGVLLPNPEEVTNEESLKDQTQEDSVEVNLEASSKLGCGDASENYGSDSEPKIELEEKPKLEVVDPSCPQNGFDAMCNKYYDEEEGVTDSVSIPQNDEQLKTGKIADENDSAELETKLDASNNENVEEGFALTADTNDFKSDKLKNGILSKSNRPKRRRRLPKLSPHEDGHTNRAIPVECDICHKTIKNKYELQRHKKNRHSEKRTEHKCPDCSYACPLPSDLKRHILRVHKGEKPIKCPWPDCEKTFSQRGNMKVHHRQHTGEKPFACVRCGKSFKAQGELEKHTLSIHIDPEVREKLKKYMCETCGQAFESNYALKIHDKVKHKGEAIEKNFSCQICGSCFPESNKLKVHVARHSEDRPVKCTRENCDKSFKNKEDLRIHLKRHDGLMQIYKYQCRYCEKIFQTAGSRQTHERLHTGEKPYACKVCKYKCADVSNLKKHERNKHRFVYTDVMY